MRIVEYAPFPRIRGDQWERRGSTRDVSPSGMCLTAERAEPVGSLVRLVVHGVDGRPTLEALARVAWSGSDASGQARLGLALLHREEAR